jgi:hypothetical protein
LRRENQLVGLKETSGRVHEDAVGDAIGQVVHPDLDIVGGRGPLDGNVEDHAKGLYRKVIEYMMLTVIRLICNLGAL